MPCFIYIAHCSDDTYYTGWTTNLERRLLAHNKGSGAKYTRIRLPISFVYTEECPDRSSAMKREYAIKKLTRLQKIQLIESTKEDIHNE
ncbi:MAG: GIY-YIG nuclease family protein [Bacilli bacterium]